MGNSNQNKNSKEFFRHTCHQALVDCHYEETQQTMWKVVKARPSMLDWYNDITRLQDKTHIFLPVRIIDHQEFMQVGCCAQENQLNPQIQLKKIYYPAFFYTLGKEILSRKKENTAFREWQLWKMIIFICKGCIEWQQVYANQSLGVICPQNIVINSKGLVKLVCKISFYEHVYNTTNPYYFAPENDPSSIIKYTFNPNCQPLAVQSAAVYSMGKVMLEAATLEPASREIDLVSRLEVLKSTLYSLQLKRVVQKMVRQDQSERPRLQQLLKYAKINRSKYQ